MTVSSKYAAEHASAYADILNAGAAVSFIYRQPGAADPSTGTYTGAIESIVDGAAIESKPNLTMYHALKLVVTKARTLLFAPKTIGQLPRLGSSIAWGNDTFVVKSVSPLSPDATAITAEVIVA